MIPLLLAACTWITEPELKDRLDVDRDGSLWPEDCDDRDPAVHPGALEICDDIDNDCDGVVDGGAVDIGTFYADKDRDGRGDPGTFQRVCHADDGWVPDDSDCDDDNGSIHPGAEEVCDDADNDCDGTVDGPTARGGTTWYLDADGDGFGLASTGVYSCDAPSGRVDNDGDCDDDDARVNPDAAEICNDFVDNDCDGGAPECRLVGEGPLEDVALRIRGDGGAFGRALLGEIDVNADGQDDLIVGAPEQGVFGEGALYVFFGPFDPHGDPLSTSDADVYLTGPQSPSAFGASLAGMGDLDGDGYPEVAVGSTSISSGSFAYTGGVYLLEGANLAAGIIGSPRLTVTGSARNDLAGSRVVNAGDLTSDGVPDLVISATFNDDFATDAGSACIVRGTTTGTISLRVTAGCVRGAAGGDQLGESLASIGDFDGEGANALVVGAPRHGSGGAVWVMPEMRTNYDNVSDEIPLYGPSAGDAFGAEVSGTGDLDGDGYDDMAVGAAGDDQGGADAGAIYLVRGRVILNESLPSNPLDLSPLVLIGQASGDGAGTVAAARDFDQDGALDLLVAAPEKATEDALDAGRVYLLYGPFAVSGSFDLADAPLRLDGGVDQEEVGRSLSPAGDLDGDGYPDLAIGAPTDAGEYDGAVYLLFGAGM